MFFGRKKNGRRFFYSINPQAVFATAVILIVLLLPVVSFIRSLLR
jgi:hypothetical protein